MKQTKLREPILYTSLWLSPLIVLIIWIWSGYKLTDTGIMLLDIILGIILAIIFGRLFVGWVVALMSWSDRNETKDMNKYYQTKIDEIEEKIQGLYQEKADIKNLMR